MSGVVALAPEPGPRLELEGDALRDWLAARYALAGDRWLRLELVAALGGQLAGSSGTSDDLTGGIDRVLLGVLRRDADAVLVGAGSVRAERLALPRSARLVVATRSGRLAPADLPSPDGDRRALVLCAADRADGLRAGLGGAAEVRPVGDGGRALRAALEDAGLGRIVCEGGGSLASALVADRVVDELDQTIAPVLAPPGGAALSAGAVPPGGPMPSADLVGLVLDDTDRLYARWRLR